MKVKLLQFTPYEALMRAVRTSHDSLNKIDTISNNIGKHDLTLLYRIIQMEHFSVLEHIVYSFEVVGVSRALLQELARHRFVSMTVQSSRYTLNKILSQHRDNLKDLIYFPEGVDPVEYYRLILPALVSMRDNDLPNDIRKYLMPEAFLTRLVMTTNARELLHILDLRMRNNVLDEFRKLARKLYWSVHAVHPEMWEYLKERYQLEVKE